MTPLPQANQPQISEQTKALFRQRWADGAVAANNSMSNASAQTAQQIMPATATANPSAKNPPSENRANQAAYIDKINQSLREK